MKKWRGAFGSLAEFGSSGVRRNRWMSLHTIRNLVKPRSTKHDLKV